MSADASAIDDAAAADAVHALRLPRLPPVRRGDRERRGGHQPVPARRHRNHRRARGAHRPRARAAQPATTASKRAPTVAFIDEDRCIGCTKCLQPCPVDAIVGAPRVMHTVIAELCTGCELCIAPCPVDCISMVPLLASPAHASLALPDAAANSRALRSAQRAHRAPRRRARRHLAEKKRGARPST